jgi:hypothetical protein
MQCNITTSTYQVVSSKTYIFKFVLQMISNKNSLNYKVTIFFTDGTMAVAPYRQLKRRSGARHHRFKRRHKYNFAKTFGRDVYFCKFINKSLEDKLNSTYIHYRSHPLPRVPQALGEELKTLGEAFPECNTRGRASGEAAHGEELFPECQNSYNWGRLPRVPR